MENENINSREEDAGAIEPVPGETVVEAPEAEVESPPADTPAVEPLELKQKSFVQKGWPWLAAVLISLLAGAALVFFLLYLPASSSLRQAQADLDGSRSALNAAETKTTELEASLTSTTGDLESAQAELQEAKLRLALSRLQANISFARLALLSKDILTARQELSDAEANLAALNLLLDDSETSSALADRLKTIRTSLTSDPSKALDEMRTLGENLARLENR